MTNNFNLDNEFLTQFFGLTNTPVPDPVTLVALKQQLKEVTKKMPKIKIEPAEDTDSDTKKSDRKSILIVDDLGVITFQLSSLLNKLGFNTVSSKEVYDAIDKFKKQDFDMVVMDLFIPTEREGLILFDELKKIANSRSLNTIIGVMSATNKKEHKVICKNKGAEFFIEKVDNWQKILFDTIVGYFNPTEEESDT